MKVTQKHLQIAVLSLGGLLVLFGVVEALIEAKMLKLPGGGLPLWFKENVPNTLFFGAAGIFLWSRSIRNKEDKERREAEEAEKRALEAEEAEAAEGTEPEASAPEETKPATEASKKD